MTKISEGTVISGTLRFEDLAPAFHDELKRVDRAAANSHEFLYARYLTSEGDMDYDLVEVEKQGEILDELYDSLCEIGGEFGLYFGSHPGDGADIGWWKNDADTL